MNNKLNGTIQPKGLFKQSVNRHVSAVLTKCSYPGAKDRKKEKEKKKIGKGFEQRKV